MLDKMIREGMQSLLPSSTPSTARQMEAGAIRMEGWGGSNGDNEDTNKDAQQLHKYKK